MINGVLVERTVKEVIPALKTNSDGLKKVLDGLLGQYKTMQDEMEKWKVSESLNSYQCTSFRKTAAHSFEYRKRIMYKLCSNNRHVNAREKERSDAPPVDRQAVSEDPYVYELKLHKRTGFSRRWLQPPWQKAPVMSHRYARIRTHIHKEAGCCKPSPALKKRDYVGKS